MEGVDRLDSACPSLSSGAASPFHAGSRIAPNSAKLSQPQPTSLGRTHHAMAAWTRRIFHTHSMHKDSLHPLKPLP